MPDIPTSAAGAMFGPTGPDTSLGNKALQPKPKPEAPEAEHEGLRGHIDEVLASVKGLGEKVKEQLRSALMAKFGDQGLLSTLSKGAAAAPQPMPQGPKGQGIQARPQAMGIRG